MKPRPLFLILFTITLFVTLVMPVGASPHQQDPQDALIRQVLKATIDELGWNASMVAFSITDYGPRYITEDHDYIDTAYIGVIPYDSESAAKNAYYDRLASSSSMQEFEFHGYPAAISAGTMWVLMERFFVFVQAQLGEDQARNSLEAFYRNAVAYGLISGEPGSGAVITPEVVVGVVTLTASADGYGAVNLSVDNSANFASLVISGRVTDQTTGAAILGATVAVVSGAGAASVLTGADGSYSLTASVPGGQNSGQVGGIDFALPLQSTLSVTVAPAQTELLADGKSATDVVVTVKDPQGNPMEGRAVTLDARGNVGLGIIQPAQVTTDATGVAHATYTAFKLDPGVKTGETRHEITLYAWDDLTATSGSEAVYVSQYQLVVLFGEYLPLCVHCNYPSQFSISVSDYWLRPVPNVPITVQLGGNQPAGTLATDPNSNQVQQTLTLTTDSNGKATVYYKWRGSQLVNEVVQPVVVLEEVTNAQEQKEVKVHGLDLAIVRVEEAGFTGVTGQQAFLKVYVKERIHPDLELDRFNQDSFNQLGLHLTMRQYHSDGSKTSPVFESTGGWERDEGGLYVRMFGTPHMPYVTPVNDGMSWYEVRVDPVDENDDFLTDLVRPNNDTIIALETGRPEGWLHIWLTDGPLTPHTWTGVVFKCVGRFLPVVGDAMTVIDTLSSAYAHDLLSLGQGTAAALTEELQRRGTPGALTKMKASTLNNVVSCAQDAYKVYKEQSQTGTGNKLAKLVFEQLRPSCASLAESEDEDVLLEALGRFAHGMFLDTPDQRVLIVYGLDAADVHLQDSQGGAFNDPERMSAEDGAVVYILPVNTQYQLLTSSAQDFEIGVYEPGSDESTRQTVRQSVMADGALTASLTVGPDSDYALAIDYEDESIPDQTQPARVESLDTVKPQLVSLSPQDGGSVAEENIVIQASYVDNPDGAGINPQAAEIFVDGIDRTAEMQSDAGQLYLQLSGLQAGGHRLRLVVADFDGNALVSETTFNIKAGLPISLQNPTLLIVIGGGVFLVLVGLMLTGVLLVRWRGRSRRPIPQAPVQPPQPQVQRDAQGNMWYQDPQAGQWQLWRGRDQARPPSQLTPPYPPYPQPKRRASRIWGCLLTLLVISIIAILIMVGLALAAYFLLPGVKIIL